MALSVPVAAAGASGSGRGGSVAFPGALTNARVSPHSRLFGFVRFHEDGARTKALLGKVRQPGDGAADTVSAAGSPLAPDSAARPVLIVAANEG